MRRIKQMKNQLTVLSFGGGQDSTAILLKLLYDKAFRQKYAPGDLVVVMSDTGDEHDYTIEHVKKIKILCAAHGIEFFHLTSDLGYHVDSWQNLIAPQLRDVGGEFKPTLVQLNTKTCTLQLKIGPIYKWLDEYINTKYSYGIPLSKKTTSGRGHDKRAIKRFGQENGNIRVLIGFAFGEEKRMIKSQRQEAKDHASKKDFWQYISRDFPLIDCKWGRAECQEYMSKFGLTVKPSNCMRCPYMSPEELLWLSRTAPAKYAEWVTIEERKIERESGAEKNYGVLCKKELLPATLAKVQAKYAHLSDAELDAFLENYKMNHGCAKGSY